MTTLPDLALLKLTLELAERGRMTCSPNPAVGCVIVKQGRIIGQGFHQRAGEGHAEVNALADADARGESVAGADVYVSLEPCSFVGRTPACADTLVDRKVRRVVCACRDPHPKVSGSGIQRLQAAGVLAEDAQLPEAERAIVGFATRVVHGRPWVRLKTATSMDGAIALADGSSQWITGPEAREDVQYWRARSDAIITGIGTVLSDDPRLTVRSPAYSHAAPPLRVVLDRRLRTPQSAALVQDGGATWLCHENMATAHSYPANVKLYVLSEEEPLEDLLKALAQGGCNEVLIEAGAKVCGAFVEQGLWDEWVAYLAPKWLGGDAMPVADFPLLQLQSAPHATVLESQALGADLRVVLRRAVS